MAVIDQHQLQFTYSRSALPPDNPLFTGNPDHAELNRHEGYEMLQFLNRNCSSLPQAWKAERLIRTKMPGNVRSHMHVVQWLSDNWNLYP